MPISEEIFRAYDVRGLLEEVTPEVARAVGMALIQKTGAKVVVVGRDMRSTSFELQKAAIEGLTAAGANVIDIGLATTSMFNFAVSSQPHVDAGLMVTASHNPPEYNGIKMALSSGLPVSGTEIFSVIKAGVVSAAVVGTVSQQNILESYLDFVLAKVELPDVSGTRIAVDYGNGMGAMSIRPLAKRLGVELVELYPEPDARFPNHEANPAIAANLKDLGAAIKRDGVDLGIAIDGDADRVAFVDELGEPLRGDQTLALLAEDLLKRRPGSKVVIAPNQSWTSKDVIERNGGVAIETRIGRTLAIQAMHGEHAELGGEVSSHFFFEETNGLESVDHALVRVLSIWKRSGKKFSELVRPLRKYANSWEVNIHVADKEHVWKRLEETYGLQASIVNRLDGLRCEFDRQWWFIVRPSNTEPLLRLTVEASSTALMEQKRDELAAFIQAV